MANDNDDLGSTNEQDETLRAALRETIGKATVLAGVEDDDGGLGSTIDKPDFNSGAVSAEEGYRLAEAAREGKTDKAVEAAFDKTIDDGGAKPAADATKPADVDAAKPDAQTEAKPADTTDITKSTVDDLLAGIDDAKRGEIARRLSAGDALTGLFAGREEEMKLHGNVTPVQAMQRMLQLNQFAQEKPDEYLAWVAGQVKPEAAHTVLESAAKILGYKLVSETEGDEFEDEATKALREENARLKRASLQYGPDAPQNTVQTTIQSTLQAFTGARDATGQLKHPHLELFRGGVAAKAAAHRDTTGQVATADDLSRFYGEVEATHRAALGLPAQVVAQPAISSAAQITPTVATPEQAKAAANIEKSKAASKMIDGAGQGADRRPALGSDAALRSVISDAIAKQKGQ